MPLFTLESCSPVAEFDLLGITIPLRADVHQHPRGARPGGHPIRAADRAESDPLVVGGGPCVYNPEPVAPFFDAILIGEGEDAVVDIVAAHRLPGRAGLSRIETLSRLSQLPGRLRALALRGSLRARRRFGAVTPIGDAPGRVTKRVVADLDVLPGAGRARSCRSWMWCTTVSASRCCAVARAAAGSARREWSTARSVSAVPIPSCAT